MRYSVTNSAKGARGAGVVLIDPETTTEVEMTEDEALLLSGFDDVKVAEVKKAKAD